MSEIEQNIKIIIKFVESFYHPTKTEVLRSSIDDEEPVIIFHFDKISDDYITNPQHRDVKSLKEQMFTRKIRANIEDYLGIKTTGLQPRNKFFSPFEHHNITIIVKSDK